MTVPAFSLPAVPTGAPPSPMGTGAAAPSGNGGLFEGLLAGAFQAEQGGWSAAGAALDDQQPVEVASEDETSPAADAGAILMLFAAAAPLADSTTPTPSDMVEAGASAVTAPAATGQGDHAFGFARPAPVALAPVVNDILGAIGPNVIDQVTDVAEAIPTPVQTGNLGDLAGRTTDAGETDSRLARAAAPAALVATAPVAVAAQATVQSAAVAPAVVAVPAAANDVETVDAAAVATPLPVSAKAFSTDGDNRRAPGAARAERRDGAGRIDAAGVSPFAPKSDLLAAGVAAGTGPAGGEAEVGSDPAPDLAALDTAEAPEARQPSLIAETHVQAPQTSAAVIDAAAARGSPETVAKMAADIVRKLDGQSTRFDLQLDPHGMGKVDVAIEIDRDGKLTAAMSFDSARSASDLRGRAGELRQALEQAGFDIAEGGLTFDLSDQGGGFGGREAGQQERAWNGRAFQRAQSGADDADQSLAAIPSIPSRWTRSGVDIRI